MPLMSGLVTDQFHEWSLSKANESSLQCRQRGAEITSDTIHHQLSSTKDTDKNSPGTLVAVVRPINRL